MLNSKITDWMEALSEGDMTVEQVAEKLRDGALSAGEGRPDALDGLADSGRPFEKDTFDEVSRALHLGMIDLDQYGILAEAAAGQVKKPDAPKAAPKVAAPKSPPAPPSGDE